MHRGTKTGTAALAAVLGLVVLPASAAAQGATPTQAGSYHVVKEIPVGGEGGWDYLTVDTAAHRLYVSRSTHVMVVDTDRDSIIADIPNTSGVHGVALAPSLGKGFTSNGRDSTVTVFDLKTYATMGTVKVTGRNPDAILYEPVTGRLFTFNGGSANATAIDPKTNAVVGTVALGGKPEFARSDAAGRVYVNNEDRSEIVVFDARTLKVLAHWPLARCEEPSGLAMDRAGMRLFSVCANRTMAVVDMSNGKVVTTLPIGDGPDASAFDPASKLVFSSNGEGTVSVYHEDDPSHFTLVSTVPTRRGARTMALDERTHKLYTVSAQFGPPPAPTADRPRPRPPMIPGSFVILVLDR